jgi:hypothetical protein
MGSHYWVPLKVGYQQKGLQDNDTYVQIGLQEYRRLRHLPKRVPKAILTMCVMTIKCNENMTPDRAKSCIVILGNLEGRLREKNQKYAPLIQYSSPRLLTSMATGNCHILKHGDHKNTFFNVKLPPEEKSIIKPPSEDPNAKSDILWLLKKTL